ncbi:MAG: leucine-rich repeat protein, partial [Clostridia bacterium]|nr:leucine-rich repeat protein [Clostridia bacterium]
TLTPVVYMGKTVAISGDTFSWFADDATETICVYPSTDATTFFRNNNIAFSYLTEEQTGDALLRRAEVAYASSTSTTVRFRWSFDETTGKLSVAPSEGETASNDSSFYLTGDTTVWHEWKEIWADAIVSFYLVNFGGYRTEWQKCDSAFSNLPNLKHVHFGTTTITYRFRRMTSGGGMFANCTSLTTISYGSDDTYDEEIDLSGWKKQDDYMIKMFMNCSSIKKVILPENLTKNSDTFPDVNITSDYFNGCTSLTEIEIPACFLSFGARAFANCPNLTHVNILGELPNGVNAAAFPDQDNLVIDVIDYNVAQKFADCGFTKTVLNYPFNGIITMMGFKVRTQSYNGLRGIFRADMSNISQYAEDNYTLLEFGTLVSSAENRANCTLTDTDGNYTAGDGVVMRELWNNVEGKTKDSRWLSTSTDTLYDFALTVTEFPKVNYMSDIYMCAYEVWENPDGAIEIFYKDCIGTDYDEVSIADICIEMWESGKVTEATDTERIVRDILDYYEENRPRNILFIGNSFTYYNDMPTAIFPVIAGAAGKEVNVTAITNGGHTLAEFATSTDTYGAKVVTAFAENEFDIVILQEQSHRPISNPESFYSAVRTLKEMARQNGAETYLYATWGYDADHTSLSTYGNDTADMEMKLRSAYEYIGSELNIPVCHVGAAMTYAFTKSDVSLYKSDNYHPLTSASTLAAMTIFSTIYDIDPATINATVDGVTEEEMTALKEASSYVYNGDMSVPEEYQTASTKPLDGKRIIFIGNSHIYYGTTVLYKHPANVLTQEARMNDQGLFYQLCKANGMNVNVTNWTFSNHILADLFGDRLCDGSGYDCVDVDHSSYLVDPYYDYVVVCYGTFNNPTYTDAMDNLIEFFTKANPNVKISLMAQATAHGVSVSNPEKDTTFLETLKDYAAKGVTILDWGKLIADIINGDVTVPGATLDYVKNTFVVDQSATDGFHPNLLTGYLTTLMTYSALTGEKAVGQPYYFVGDESYCSNSYYRTFDEYKAAYYTYNNATTNFDQVFASAVDMTGLQTLVDQYLADKAYENYDFKKIIFIGDSFIYWGNTVLDKGYNTTSKVGNSLRRYDTGLFYQLCKANGMDVNVVNWTFGSHGIGSIMNENGCGVSSSCPCYEGKSHMSYLTDTDFDYVVISGGRNSATSYESYVNYLTYYKDYFTATNPDVKMYYLVSSGAHNVSVAETFPIEILNNLDEFEKMGYTIIDWGKLVKDLIDGTAVVTDTDLVYNKNSFVVSRSNADGYHPNQLAGYITTLMTYCAIFGESAVGQPYSFVGDTTLSPESNYYSFEDYVATYYTYDGATTNYPDVFASEKDMKGIQTLIDQYLAEKAYLNYNFTATE